MTFFLYLPLLFFEKAYNLKKVDGKLKSTCLIKKNEKGGFTYENFSKIKWKFISCYSIPH